MPLGDGVVPAAFGVGNLRRIPSAAHGFFVANADDVVAEVRQGIAKIPGDIAEAGIRTIPSRGARLIGITEPPDGIDFIIEMDGRQVGAHGHDDAVPFRFWRGGAEALRRAFQRGTFLRQQGAHDQQQRVTAGKTFRPECFSHQGVTHPI